MGGEKDKEKLAIGCEYEALVIDPKHKKTVSYTGPNGIEAILRFMAERLQWQPMVESGQLIALTKDNKSITLEPGGQFELSGAPYRTLLEVKAELDLHVQELQTLEEHFGLSFQWRGLNPFQSTEQVNWMPKPRYEIMRRYLPTQGALAKTMMGLTCTVQTNLDYWSEEHFSRALRTTTGIGALVTAMFANSPWVHGDSKRYQSYRSLVWTQVDPDRCGIQPFIFESDCGYADYVDWAVNVPMFFLYREGTYIEMGGRASFLDLMEHRVSGHDASMKDWDLHLSTVFPDVRAKTHLEFRTADVVPPQVIPACPALWKGIVYSDACLDAAWDLVKKWSLSQRRDFAKAVACEGLKARLPVGAGVAQDLCRELLSIASSGLQEQAVSGHADDEDQQYLEPLYEILSSGVTWADKANKIN